MLIRQPFDAEAGCLLRLFTDLLEDLFQVLDMSLSLLLMLLQRLLELSVERFFLQLRQHLQNLLLRAHRIRQLMHEQLAHRTNGHDSLLLTTLDGAGLRCTYADGVPTARAETCSSV